MSDSIEESLQLRERAFQTYRDLISEDPTNVEALVGLAAIVDTREERVDLWERIVEVEPTYIPAWEWFSSDEPEDLIRAAQYLEQAYNAATGNKRWALAADVVLNYELAGSPSEAGPFVDRIRRDFGLDQKVSWFIDVSSLHPDVREQTLREVCGDSAMIIFGATACFDAINAVVSFLDDNPATQFSVSAAEDVANAMLVAGNLGWRIESQYPAWHDSLLGWMEQLVESDNATADVYVAQARLATTDKVKRLTAMRNAARLAPGDGDIAFGLALAYFDLERWNEAAEELNRARNLLPAARREVIDEFLVRAANAIAEESTQ